MIERDQPDCFPDNLVAYVSSKADRSMLNRAIGTHNPAIVANRQGFCRQAGIDYARTAYQRIVYDEARTYALIAEVDAGSVSGVTPEIVADALFTRAANVGLFLPVADCAATVVYDPRQHLLAVAHLGRHSTYANLAAHVVRHFVANGSQQGDLLIWLSPHAQKDSYKLAWFDRTDDPSWHGFYRQADDGVYVDLAGYNRAQFISAGVPAANIAVSAVDTMTDSNYFSYASDRTDDRIAVIAYMR